MAVRMRLMRMGKKKQPVYRVVVVDGRSPRDGRYIEQVGRYDPRQEPSLVEIDNDKATSWLGKGAQPSETVEKLLNISGAMNTKKDQPREIHVVGVHAGSDEPVEVADATSAEEDDAVSGETAADGEGADEVEAAVSEEE